MASPREVLEFKDPRAVIDRDLIERKLQPIAVDARELESLEKKLVEEERKKLIWF